MPEPLSLLRDPPAVSCPFSLHCLPTAPCPPSGHLVNVSLTIVNRLKQRRATIMAAVPVSLLLLSPWPRGVQNPPERTWLCLPAGTLVYVECILGPERLSIFRLSTRWIGFFVRGETLVLLLHAKRVLRVVIVLRPTLVVKFFGAQLLQVKYVRKYLWNRWD